MQVPNTIPIGTYFIRAFVLKNSTKVGGLPQSQVAFGTSKGYFQVRIWIRSPHLHSSSCKAPMCENFNGSVGYIVSFRTLKSTVPAENHERP